MPVPWNTTAPNTLVGLWSHINVASEGVYGLMLMIALYVTIYILVSMKFESSEGLLIASAIVALMSFLFYTAGVIYGYLVAAAIVVFLISVGIYMSGGKR